MSLLVEAAKLEAPVLVENATDTNVLLNIWYDGPETTATIDITATTMVGLAGGSAAAWGTAGVITFATFGSAPGTAAEIADEINTESSRGWHCDVMGCISTQVIDDSYLIEPASATSCLKADDGFDCLGDTSNCLVAGYKITNLTPHASDRGAVHILYESRLNSTHSAGTQTGNVYICSGAEDGGVPTSETLVFSPGTVSTTVELVDDINDFGFGEQPIRGAPGDQILITVTGGTTVTAGFIKAVKSSIGEGFTRRKFRSGRQ